MEDFNRLAAIWTEQRIKDWQERFDCYCQLSDAARICDLKLIENLTAKVLIR